MEQDTAAQLERGEAQVEEKSDVQPPSFELARYCSCSSGKRLVSKTVSYIHAACVASFSHLDKLEFNCHTQW